MTTATGVEDRAFAIDFLRSRAGTGTPLAPVPTRAILGWNGRVRRWAAAA